MNIIELTEDNVEEYMEYLTEDIAENIGRCGETKRIMTLKALKDADANMFCTVFIGNGTTK